MKRKDKTFERWCSDSAFRHQWFADLKTEKTPKQKPVKKEKAK